MSHAQGHRKGVNDEVAIELEPFFRDLPSSPTLQINETVRRLWQDGETVYHLGFGESRFPVHPRLLAGLGEHGRAKSYLPGRGLPALLDAVAAWYTRHLGIDFDPGQVVVGPGSKALIYAVQMAVSAELYLPSPSWVSYAPQAEMLGKRVRYIPSRVEDDHALDLDAFEQLLATATTRQRLLIINSPNNPTGGMLDPAELEALAGFCREHNVIVLSDEIYFRVCGDRKHESIAKWYPEGTIILGGLSKHLSIGGWRLGVALFPDTESGRDLLRTVVAIASETWSAVAAPVQHAAVIAYEGSEAIESYTKQCSAIHGIRTRHLRAGLEHLGIRCTPAEGAFYIMANFDRWRQELAALGIETADELAMHLLESYRIAALPGSAFGLPPTTLSLRLASSYLDMETDADGDRVLRLYEADPDTLMAPRNHPGFAACLDAFGQFVKQLTAAGIPGA